MRMISCPPVIQFLLGLPAVEYPTLKGLAASSRNRCIAIDGSVGTYEETGFAHCCIRSTSAGRRQQSRCYGLSVLIYDKLFGIYCRNTCWKVEETWQGIKRNPPYIAVTISRYGTYGTTTPVGFWNPLFQIVQLQVFWREGRGKACLCKNCIPAKLFQVDLHWAIFGRGHSWTAERSSLCIPDPSNWLWTVMLSPLQNFTFDAFFSTSHVHHSTVAPKLYFLAFTVFYKEVCAWPRARCCHCFKRPFWTDVCHHSLLVIQKGSSHVVKYTAILHIFAVTWNKL